jgi:hypothetical protein
MKELQTLSIVAPGFFGLNTEESGVTLSTNFAQLADNTVIDKFGRLGARKGWLMKTEDGVDELSGENITFLMEHVNADNTTITLSGGNNKLFAGGDDGSTLTDITPALYTITADYWRGASIYDHALLVQADHEPVVYTEAATPVAQTITDYRSGGTPNFGTTYPKGVIAAYGRFWTFTDDTVYWSTDIADSTFPAFYGGTSGFLNIAAVLPNNVDTITGLASHNGFLIIFCKSNIVLYSGANDVIGSFAFADVIAGVGCITDKSIQGTGNDLLFMSDTGVRSLGRLIQEKSLPMRDLTKNIRQDFVKDIAYEISAGDLDKVCSTYSEDNAFYLLSFPSSKTVYCFDMKQSLEDGSARITVWFPYEAFAFERKQDRSVLIGKKNGIGKYEGYTDNGAAYRLRYLSHYTDFGSPTAIKILKQIKVSVLGGSNQQFTIKVGTNYTDAFTTYPFIIGSFEIAEYGLSEYNVGYYSGGVSLDKLASSVGGSGNVVQFGFEADVNGSELSVQNLDAYVKTGRIN